MDARSASRLDSIVPIPLPAKAPIRYPAKFAAPSATVVAEENQLASMSAGISGVYPNRARPIETKFADKPAIVANQSERLRVVLATSCGELAEFSDMLMKLSPL